MDGQADYLPQKVKIVLLGDSYAGKISIIDSYLNKLFNSFYKPATSLDFTVKVVERHSKKYRLQLWDSAGQERFVSLASNYTKNADCLAIVFDVASSQIGPSASETQMQAHLEKVTSKWVKLYEENNTDNGFMVLVGNKIDVKNRTISYEAAKNKAIKMGVQYFQVSAKTNQNIDNMFNSIIDRYEQSQVQKTFKTNSSRYKLMTDKITPFREGKALNKTKSVHGEYIRLKNFDPTEPSEQNKSRPIVLSNITSSTVSDDRNQKCKC